MANADKLAAAGVENVDVPQPKSRKSKEQKKDNREHQAAVLSPSFVHVANEETGREIAIPAKFTIGDIAHRKALDDLEAFVKLVAAEIKHLSPDLPNPLMALFDPNLLGFAEAALSLENVRDFCRRIIVKVARMVHDGEVSQDRVTSDDVEAIDNQGLATISVWFIRRYLEAAVEAKKTQRTTITLR